MAKNILQIIPQIATGGAERIVFESAKAVIENGDNCFIFTNGGRMAAQFNAIGAKIIIGDAKSKNPFKILFSNVAILKQIIKENNIDLIHVHSRAPAISAFYAAKSMGIKLITTYHGIYPAKNAVKRYYNSFMTKADLIIANSRFTMAHIIEQHKINHGKLRLIYCGIDMQNFSLENISKERQEKLLNDWNINPKSRKIVLLPARLTSWKGQMLLIEAAAILKAKGILPLYILAGDDQGRVEYTQSLKQAIETHELQENIKLVGHCDDVPAAMALSDIIVTPSIKEEAFGMTAAEAQAMGKITIASRLGASVETVLHEESGFLFSPANANDLAKYLEIALNFDAAQVAAFAQAGKAHANSLFSSQLLHDATLKVYDETLKL